MLVAFPKNVGSGTKLTVPSLFTVYVPSPATVRVVPEHTATALAPTDEAAHIFTDVATRVVPVPAASLETGVSFCALFHGPLDVSSTSVGAGGIIGVRVDVTV